MAKAKKSKVKKVKKAHKQAENAHAKPAVKKAADKKERKLVSAADMKEIEKYDTKKGKVITLREKEYSINAIGLAVGLHPTNVSRYIREAGLSTSVVKVPKERKDRIKATIAAHKAAHPKAAKIEKAPNAEKKTKVKVAAKAKK